MKTLALVINEIENSKEIVRYASLFANDINAKVHILYVQKPINYGTYGLAGMATFPEPKLNEKLTDEINEKIVDTIKEVKAELTNNVSIEYEYEVGSASILLKEKVENQFYDMIMLQSQTEQGFLLQSSIIMDVVRDVPCPVYIIPSDAKYQPFKKIIYATDYNDEDISTFKSLIKLAKPFEPEILAIHISNDNEFEKKLKSEGFEKMLSEKTGNNKVSVIMIAEEDGKDAVESFVNEAEKSKANLIVVLKENRNFFERLFKSSFTAELVKRTQLPILVFLEPIED